MKQKESKDGHFEILLGLLFSSQGADQLQRQFWGANRQRPLTTIEMSGRISSSEKLVNILLRNSARVGGGGAGKYRAVCEIAVPSAFGDEKKPSSVEINFSKNPYKAHGICLPTEGPAPQVHTYRGDCDSKG